MKATARLDRARKYLKTGVAGKMEPDQLMVVCDELVRAETQRSSKRAVELGRQFVHRMKKAGGEGLLTAWRALGWAFLIHNDYPASEKSYLQARKRCVRQADQRSRIDRVLIDVYMYLGQVDEARRRARMATRAFRRLGNYEELAKTRVNYANVLHRLDRHQEAHKLYSQAITYFRKRHNNLAIALCGYNQANTLVQLFRLDAAEPLYNEARKIFQRQRYTLWSNNCLNGLAWLHMLKGDFHIALQELTECEKGFRGAGQRREVVLCQLDRAEVYLALNLFTDARNMARDAERRARKLGISYEVAKSAFFYAKASLGMGRLADARKALRRARKEFEETGNSAFLSAVGLLESHLKSGTAPAYKEIENARRGFTRTQLPLWEAICDLQIVSEWPDKLAAERRLKANPAVKAVPYLQARWLTLKGDRAAGDGRLKTAVAKWSEAANLLDAVRAKLPPVELRAAFFKTKHSQPHLKLIDTLADREPESAAAWTERYRTSGKWSTSTGLSRARRACRKAQESLASLASHVTVLASQLQLSGSRSTLTGALQSKSLRRIQNKVRLDLAKINYTSDRIADIESLKRSFAKAARRHPIVQFQLSDRDLYAFVHHGKSVHCHRYGFGLERLDEFVGRWRFLVERYANSRSKVTAADLRDERAMLSQMGDWLWSPLEIPAGATIIMLPESTLGNLPWHAMIVSGQSVLDRNTVVFAPSLRHHLYAREHLSRSNRVEIFVGSTKGLKHPERDFARLLETRSAIVHRDCDRSDWPDRSRAAIWHYVGHAELRSDNPFYSSLVLHNQRLFAADLLLKRNIVDLVTLAACRTGQQARLPGDESTGLVRAFLEMGARNVLASHWAVNDRSSSLWMDNFYSSYTNQNKLYEAFRNTALSIRDSFPSAYDWAAFSIFGAGE